MLKKLIVKNYKSLADLTLELNPLNVFVGPNNAGKSNIFDCLKLINDLATTESTFNIRGGFHQIVFNGDLKLPIEITLKGLISSKDAGSFDYKYFLDIRGDRYGRQEINQEKFSIKVQVEEQTILEYPFGQNRSIRYKGADQVGLSRPWRKTCLFEYYHDPVSAPEAGKFTVDVKSWGFYNFLPPLMQKPQPVRRQSHIQEYGENAPLVLHLLQSEYPKNFDKIEEILKQAISEIKELSTGLTEGGETFLRVEEKGVTIQIPAWAMSDGTLRFLAHLSVLYNPNLPTLICFEEPENYIHPQLLELLAGLIKLASEKTQILVTTHSPLFLDFFEPENVAIVEKLDGKTQVKWAEDTKGVKEALKNLGLGEIWYSGNLGGVP